MKELLKKLPEHAKKKRKENATFFAKLKKRPPKNLDYLMQDLHEQTFATINCLACANCCKTTGPLFTKKDLVRIAKYLKLKPAEFIKKYLQIDEDNDYVLQQLPCVFLDAQNYCTIYNVRPKACKEYPHTNRKKFQQITALTLKNTTICPAVFEIVEALKKKID